MEPTTKCAKLKKFVLWGPSRVAKALTVPPCLIPDAGEIKWCSSQYEDPKDALDALRGAVEQRLKAYRGRLEGLVFTLRVLMVLSLIVCMVPPAFPLLILTALAWIFMAGAILELQKVRHGGYIKEFEKVYEDALLEEETNGDDGYAPPVLAEPLAEPLAGVV